MKTEEVWTQAFLSALNRLPLEEAKDEADAALALVQARELTHPPTQRDWVERGWVGVTLLGWPTPEDMQRVIRPDGSDFILEEVFQDKHNM